MIFKRIFRNRHFYSTSVLAIYFFILFYFIYISSAFADFPLFRKHISCWNLDQHKLSLSDKTYRGEEGILRISPEVGKSLGLKVLINEDYLEATKLYQEAEKIFKTSDDILDSFQGEKDPEAQILRIKEIALRHNKAVSLAWDRMMAYHSRLTSKVDDRLNDNVCAIILEKVLKQQIEKASYNLRDALAFFYNRCQEIDKNPPLNNENIKFVNYVFRKFIENAPKEAISVFDLDKCEKKDAKESWPIWKAALGNSSSRFASLIENAFKKNQQAKNTVDVMLFLALLRQESNFKPDNISYVGAAGLAQIMPSTAKSLGMKNIFTPPYFKEAGSLLGRERKLKNQAKKLFLEITEENGDTLAKQVRDLMQQAVSCHETREELYTRYKEELLKDGKDERLNAQKAIEHGLKYFAQMMEIQKGDVSLALASYNAGPHRVKQYKGIPPYDETIGFRNKVLNYYRIYLARANGPKTVSKKPIQK